MRSDPALFAAANAATSKSPRHIINIEFPTASLYITSHSGISGVPGVVLEGMVVRPNVVSQRIVPDEGRSEIGSADFEVLDKASAFTDQIRTKLLSDSSGLRGKTVRFYRGFEGFAFSDFQLEATQIVSEAAYENGKYSITCRDITRELRKKCFDLATTTLTNSITASDTTLTVGSTAAFELVQHDDGYTDAPNVLVGYIKLKDEIIRYTGKTATTFTGCTRGALGTRAVAVAVDPAVTADRRQKIEEYVYLEGPAVKIMLGVMTGAAPGNLMGPLGGMATDGNSDGLSDGWANYSNAGTFSRPTPGPSGSGNFQRFVTSGADGRICNALPLPYVRAGEPFTVSAYVLATAGTQIAVGAKGYDTASGSETVQYGSTVISASGGWDRITFSDVSESAGQYIRITAGIQSGGGAGTTVDVDDAQIEVWPSVNPYTTEYGGMLPLTWQLDVAQSFIRLSDYTVAGNDLWDPLDSLVGMPVRFEGLKSQDGKAFLGKEILILLGCYQPVYADGTLGLRRMVRILQNATPVMILDERNSVQVGPLTHDMGALHNIFQIDWNWNGEDFTRRNVFADQISFAVHGESDKYEREFKGVHGSRHTDGFIFRMLDSLRDRYAGPPERIRVQLLHNCNMLEVGDIVRVKYASVRDYAGPAGSIDRAFEVQGITDNGVDLTVDLFGSTAIASTNSPTTAATALPDAFYTGAGTQLSTVPGVTIGSDILTAAPGSPISGGTTVDSTAAIYYHNGPLTINAGVTLRFAGNWQLRVRGHLTINGTIEGIGQGQVGVSDSGGALLVNSNGDFGIAAFNTIAGNPGYVGNSKGAEGVQTKRVLRVPTRLHHIPSALVKAKHPAAPYLELVVSGNNLVGLAGIDLRGSGGAPGGRAIEFINGSIDNSVNGGPGANGGGGLCIVCRGMSFGASGNINLSGNNAAAQSSVDNDAGMFIYPGAGGGGGPGTLYVLLDGNVSKPSIGLGNFTALCGTVGLPGSPLPQRDSMIVNGAIRSLSPARAYDIDIISGTNLFNEAQWVQYIPAPQTATPDVEEMPAAPTGLEAIGEYGYANVRLTLPDLALFDVAQVYASLDNNRVNAVKVGEGRQAEFVHELPNAATRYYWCRTVKRGIGPDKFSDWFPSGVNSGVAATTLSTLQDEGMFFESWDHQRWETLWDNIANGAVTVTYPNDGEYGGKVIQAAGAQLWIQSKQNIPYDPNSLYRITAKIRRTSSSGGANQICYLGVAGIAANGVDYINEAGTNSSGSQHYNCFRGFDVSTLAVNTWTIGVGYFRGHGTTGFGVAAHRDVPTPLYTGVRYFRPLIILNYNAGNGTEQCDWIRVERLIQPDDADNSDKQRIVPDAEFALATDETYWDLASASGVPTISLTGGIEYGIVTWTGNGNAKTIQSKRDPPRHSVAGELYTIRLRWRRTGTLSTSDSTIPIFRVYPGRYGPGDAAGYAYVAGGINMFAAEANARTVNEWQFDEAIAMLNKLGSGGATTDTEVPWVSALLEVMSVHSGGTVEVDYFDIVPGAGANPYRRTHTGSVSVIASDHWTEMVYDSASAGNFTLITISAQYVGTKVYFRQAGSGLLTIVQGGGATVQSPPNTTGNRALSGRYARAFAEVVAADTWLLQGSLA